MSEEKEHVTEEQQALDLTDLIEKLVPPKKIEVLDIFGNSYEKPTVLSARKQIKVVREFEKAITHIQDFEVSKELGAAQIIDILIRSATDDNVLHHFCNCFTIAYPEVVKLSSAYAKERSIDIEANDPVLDLFAIEDIIGSIVPLFIRLVKKVGGAITILNKIAQ